MTVADTPVYTGPRMPFRSRIRHVLVIAAAAVAFAPASALAQGAGDDQYNDPFGGEEEQAKPAPTAAPRRPAPTPAAPPAAAQATATPAGPQATATPSPGPNLPYTGVDAWPLALGGALLLGSGLALRARLREPD